MAAKARLGGLAGRSRGLAAAARRLIHCCCTQASELLQKLEALVLVRLGKRKWLVRHYKIMNISHTIFDKI
jgi:hypothetical protein